MSLPDTLQGLAESSKAWPFEEARKTLARARKLGARKLFSKLDMGQAASRILAHLAKWPAPPWCVRRFICSRRICPRG